jgi:predicted RNA-binding protein with PUA-like domain
MPVKTPVTLAEIKAHPDLSDVFLVRHSRLSVGPIAAKDWKIICKMAEIKA